MLRRFFDIITDELFTHRRGWKRNQSLGALWTVDQQFEHISMQIAAFFGFYHRPIWFSSPRSISIKF